MLIKNYLFNLHYYGSKICTYGWILHRKFIYIHYIVYISWLLNDNKCLLSQLEYYIYGETFMGKDKKFTVPLITRDLLFINLVLSTIYRFSYNKYLISN